MSLKIDNRIIDLEELLKLWCNGFFVVCGSKREIDNHERQIIEEVCFLCLSEVFLASLEEFREKISDITGVRLPVKDEKQAKELLIVLYENNYEVYRDRIQKMIKKFRLVSSLYWKDHMMFFEDRVRSIIEDEEVGRAEAESRFFYWLEYCIEGQDLALLEKIIFLNTPLVLGDIPFWLNSHMTRKTHSSYIRNNVSLPRIIFEFPIYATKREVIRIIKGDWSDIEHKRSMITTIDMRRDHRKDKLDKMITAYQLKMRGESITGIAIKLDKKYGGDASESSVRVMISRVQKELDKFE